MFGELVKAWSRRSFPSAYSTKNSTTWQGMWAHDGWLICPLLPQMLAVHERLARHFFLQNLKYGHVVPKVRSATGEDLRRTARKVQPMPSTLLVGQGGL